MSSSQIEIKTIDDKMDIINDIELKKINARIELLAYIFYTIQEIINPYLEISKNIPIEQLNIEDILDVDKFEEFYTAEKQSIIALQEAKNNLDKESNRRWLSKQFNRKEFSEANKAFTKAIENRQIAFLNVSAENKKINKKLKEYAQSTIDKLESVILEEDNFKKLKDKLQIYLKLLISSIDTKKVFSEPLFIALNKSKQYSVNIQNILKEAEPYYSKITELTANVSKVFSDIQTIYKNYQKNYGSIILNEDYNDDLGIVLKDIKIKLNIDALKKLIEVKKGGAVDDIDISNKIKESDKVVNECESIKSDIIKLYEDTLSKVREAITKIESSLREAGEGIFGTSLGVAKNYYKYVPQAIETIFTQLQTIESTTKLAKGNIENKEKEITEKSSKVSVIVTELQDAINVMLNLSKSEITQIKQEIEKNIEKENKDLENQRIRNEIDEIRNEIDTEFNGIEAKLQPYDLYFSKLEQYLTDNNLKAFINNTKNILVFQNITKLLNEKNIDEFIYNEQKGKGLKQLNGDYKILKNTFINIYKKDFFNRIIKTVDTPLKSLETIQKELDKLNEINTTYQKEKIKTEELESLIASTAKDIMKFKQLSQQVVTEESKLIDKINKDIQSETGNLKNTIDQLNIDTFYETDKKIKNYEHKLNLLVEQYRDNYKLVQKLTAVFLKDILEYYNNQLQKVNNNYKNSINNKAIEEINKAIAEINKAIAEIKKAIAEINKPIAEIVKIVKIEDITQYISDVVGKIDFNKLLNGIKQTITTLKEQLLSSSDKKKLNDFIEECEDNFNTPYSTIDKFSFSKKENLLDKLKSLNNSFPQKYQGGAVLEKIEPLPSITSKLETLNTFINTKFELTDKTPDKINYQKDFKKAYDDYITAQKQLDSIQKSVITEEEKFNKAIQSYIDSFDKLGKLYETIEKESDLTKIKESEDLFTTLGTDIQTELIDSESSILNLKKLNKQYIETKEKLTELENIINQNYTEKNINNVLLDKSFNLSSVNSSALNLPPRRGFQSMPTVPMKDIILLQGQKDQERSFEINTSSNKIQQQPPPTNNKEPEQQPLPLNFIQPPNNYMYQSSATERETAALVARQNISMLLDQRSLPISHLVPLMFSIICLVVGLFISIYYIIILGMTMITNSAVSAPLNNQTTDFETIKSLSFFGSGKFNYLNFLLLPLLSLAGLAIFAIVSVVYPTPNPIPREIKGLIFIIGLSALITLVVQYFVYNYLGSTILNVGKRLKYFNRYICLRIYKNLALLNIIKDPQTSIVNVNITMQNALKVIPLDIEEQELAKAFFTLTMFYHYQKIGLRNESIFKAFNLFDPFTLLTGGCSPGDYLPRYGTYIEDITETIIRDQISQEFKNTRPKELENAIMLCNEWITSANGYANTIYPEDAFTAFIVMALVTVAVQLIPLLIVFSFYGKSKTSIVLQNGAKQLGLF